MHRNHFQQLHELQTRPLFVLEKCISTKQFPEKKAKAISLFFHFDYGLQAFMKYVFVEISCNLFEGFSDLAKLQWSV